MTQNAFSDPNDVATPQNLSRHDPSPVSPDPVFAAVEAARAADAAVDALAIDDLHLSPDGRIRDDAGLLDELRRARRAALTTPPTTRAGQLLLVEYLSEQMVRQASLGPAVTGDEPPFWAGVCCALRAVVRTPIGADRAPTAVSATRTADPVFAMIEAHCAAYAEWDRIASVWNGMGSDDPGYAAAEVAADLPGRREIEAYEALFTARPTTLMGAKALTEYLATAIERTRPGDHPSDGERALRAISNALADLLGPQATDGAGRDWGAYAARHPGFVPYPAHAPKALMELDLAIRGEAERFLELAEAEVERRRQHYAGFPDPAVWPRVERELRCELRMDALALVAAKPSDDDGPSEPDPALAAFEASRRAEAEMAAFGEEATAPMTPEMRAREDTLCEAQRTTRATAWATVPTTRSGRVALVEYARLQIEVHRAPDGKVHSAEDLLGEILGALEAAIRGERPEIASAPSADPAGGDPSNLDALALVSAIEAEWEAQAQPGYDALPMADDEAGYARRSALLSAADLLPADTRAARHAKALALAWIVYADLWQPGHTRDSYATNGRLALDINGAFRTSITTEHPDAALLTLGPTIAALITARDAVPPEHEEAYAKIDGLVLDEGRRLAAMPARTLAGLVLKARFVERGADEELKDAIVADLLALGGGE